MAMQLAIGYLAGSRRSRAARPDEAFATPTGRDPLSSRPAIPQAVITWSDAEAAAPPVGAGDPASAIAGPARFTTLRDRSHRLARGRPLTLDAVLFSVLVATFAGLASAVLLDSGARSNAWVSYESVAAMPPASVNVEVNGLRIVESPALAAKDAGTTAAN